jgi:hypothetical protein
LAGFSPSRFGEGPGERLTSHEWAQDAGKPKAHGGGQTGVQGGIAPMAGGWGASPVHAD